jgi:hydrogenase maturation protease
VSASDATPPSVMVIGLGNLDRGDDGAGLLVARGVRAADARAEVIEVRDEAACLDALQTAGDVIVIDAMRSGADAGSVRRIDLEGETLPLSFASRSTHALGLATAIELARALNGRLGHIVFYGIEGRTFDLGSTLSSEVARAVQSTTDAVLADLRRRETYARVGDA